MATVSGWSHPFYQLPIPIQRHPRVTLVITIVALAVLAKRRSEGKKAPAVALVKAAPFRSAPTPKTAPKKAASKTAISKAQKAFVATATVACFARLIFTWRIRPPAPTKEDAVLLASIEKNLADYRKYMIRDLIPGVHEDCSTANPELILERLKKIPVDHSVKHLKLNGLSVTVFPEELCTLLAEKFPNTTKINLSKNHLKKLPASIAQHTKLQSLIVSNNHLESLPPEIGQCSKLEKICANNNRLTTLPDTIGDCTSLTELFVVSNRLKSLPSSITSLKNLKRLCLHYNDLTSLPKDFDTLEKLEELTLYFNAFDALPPLHPNINTCRLHPLNKQTMLATIRRDLVVWQKLVTKLLTVGRHRGFNLPSSAEQILDFFINSWSLQNSIQLDFSGLSLEVFPVDFFALVAHWCPNITRLNLSDNKLSELPPIAQFFPKLQVLNLSGNVFEAVPAGVAHCASLKELNFSSNRLKSLPEDFGCLHCLEVLNLADNGLKQLPVSFTALQALRECDLSNNGLEVLPDEFALDTSATGDTTSLAQLQRLILRDNKLSALPEGFGSLLSLVELDLAQNQFQQFPAIICGLTKLTSLNLSINQIDAVPEEVGSLTSLEQLYLSRNQIEKLPNSLGHLKALTHFSANGNELTALPINLLSLENLEALCVSHNKIQGLPSALHLLRKLTRVELSFNDIKDFPSALLNPPFSNISNQVFIQENPAYTALFNHLRTLIQQNLVNTPVYQNANLHSQISQANNFIDYQMNQEALLRLLSYGSGLDYLDLQRLLTPDTPTPAAPVIADLPPELKAAEQLFKNLSVEYAVKPDSHGPAMQALGEVMLGQLKGWDQVSEIVQEDFLTYVEEKRGTDIIFSNFSPFLVMERCENGQTQWIDTSCGEHTPETHSSCPVSLLHKYRTPLVAPGQPSAFTNLNRKNLATGDSNRLTKQLKDIVSRQRYDEILDWVRLQWHTFKEGSAFFQKQALDALLSLEETHREDDYASQVNVLKEKVKELAKAELKDLEGLPSVLVKEPEKQHMTFLRNILIKDLKEQLTALEGKKDISFIRKKAYLKRQINQLEAKIDGGGGKKD